LDPRLEADHARRLSELEQLDALGEGHRTAPEDGSFDPDVLTMAFGQESDDLAFAAEMARIGQTEGFTVQVRSRDTELVRQALSDDIAVLPTDETFQDVWTEDHGELGVNGGTVSYPAFLPLDQSLSNTLYRERVRRYYGAELDASLTGTELRGAVASDYPDALFDLQGHVNRRELQRQTAALAIQQGRESRQQLGYLEGGNVLTGTLASGEGYALVGRDSYALSRLAMEQSLGREVSDDEVHRAIAYDLGVNPRNLHPVEQPGAFHLDMHMAVVGEGTVILNDAREVARLQIEWMRAELEALRPVEPGPDATQEARDAYARADSTWQARSRLFTQDAQALEQAAERLAQHEARTLQDLEASGLNVVRMAGVFPAQGRTPQMNFLNAEQGTGPDGSRYYIALGGSPQAQAYVEQMLTEVLPAGIARVHFLDPSLTAPSLALRGGISCRVKADGTLVG
jgi:hypothetical protein